MNTFLWKKLCHTSKLDSPIVGYMSRRQQKESNKKNPTSKNKRRNQTGYALYSQWLTTSAWMSFFALITERSGMSCCWRSTNTPPQVSSRICRNIGPWWTSRNLSHTALNNSSLPPLNWTGLVRSSKDTKTVFRAGSSSASEVATALMMKPSRKGAKKEENRYDFVGIDIDISRKKKQHMANVRERPWKSLNVYCTIRILKYTEKWLSDQWPHPIRRPCPSNPLFFHVVAPPYPYRGWVGFDIDGITTVD